MSESGMFRSTEEQNAAEEFNNKKLKPEEGVAKSLTKGTLKGGTEAIATIVAASVKEGPVPPANIFKDENEKNNNVSPSKDNEKGAEKLNEAPGKPQEGEVQQGTTPDTDAERRRQKREAKADKSGRARMQAPASSA